jgi:hydrogenase maturation protein HypF
MGDAAGKKTPRRFEIRCSGNDGSLAVNLPPDIGICPSCLRDLFDPGNRRYLYPFTACSDCGPRFTMVTGLPYDRPRTTMHPFRMCPDCRSEYENHSDRRFHAQPIACPVCGPRLSLLDSTGKEVPGEPVRETVQLLHDGAIVAVKGLGGFHLAADALSETAIRRLRDRKKREGKPFAIMTGSIREAHRFVDAGDRDTELLGSPQRPIVLLRRIPGSGLAESVAPGCNRLGIMLPYTPLHYLYFFHPDCGGDYSAGRSLFPALVMTSGNVNGEAICRDNHEAMHRLSGIADAFLLFDRDIYVRCDDSVVDASGATVTIVRRSRGYAPSPVCVPKALPTVLAAGGEQKNTVCLIHHGKAIVSQHIGDVENAETFEAFEEAVNHLTGLLQCRPDVYACDLHPEYLTSKYVRSHRRPVSEEKPLICSIQHHHAHIASVLAENDHPGPVIGFSMDGTGYGCDGTAWGGEALICTAERFERAAHLHPVPLPGGAAAIREPWRMAVSWLESAFPESWETLDIPSLRQVSSDRLTLLMNACRAGLNSPPTSSLGRLFDACASLLGLCHIVSYEGQAAVLLEQAAEASMCGSALPYEIHPLPPVFYSPYPLGEGAAFPEETPGKPWIRTRYEMDFRPMIRALVDTVRKGRGKGEPAFSFHATLLAAFREIAERIRADTGINVAALSGGCWQNGLLRERFAAMLTECGFDVLMNNRVPLNDGGLSLGQAWVAAHVARSFSREKMECALQSP